MYIYILCKNSPKVINILGIYSAMYIKFLFYRNYYLWPSTKGVYPVQLTDEDYLDFHWQTFMQNRIYKNHFFDYEDTHAKYRTQKADIFTGLAPLRCVHGPRTWHKTDNSMIDLVKRQGLGPRISYKVTFILHKHLSKKNMKFVHFNFYF